MPTTSPLIISLGDPCGVGPEIVAGAWRALSGEPGLVFCVVGDAATLERQASVVRISAPAEAAQGFATAIPVLNRPLDAPAVPGQPDSRHAPHIIGWIREGVELCHSGAARGLVTAPIAKAVLYDAGFTFPGHTEFLAELCHHGDTVPTPVMMLTAPDTANDGELRVVLATIHTPLAKVAASLNADHLKAVVRITEAALKRDFGISAPRLVMAGLNPHAGEDGGIGDEEQTLLIPVARALRDEGVDVRGPIPADSLFHQAARRTYDAAICMYHDQGLIPLKTLDFWSGVNITLGLDIVRTSPDHGTAFDIAGQGKARPDSLIAAIRAADAIARRRAAQ